MPKDCKYCNNPIAEWKEVGGRKVPYNPDGSPHKCKDGKLIKTAIPADSLPTIGLLVSYDENLATFLTEDGRQHSYANTKDNYQAWQRAGHNMPQENHPDVWLAFRLSAAKFVMGGATVVQRPPWADRVKDPTGGEVKQPFKTGKEILQETLDQKRAEAATQETPTEAPGSSGPANPLTTPETAPQTSLAPAQEPDVSEEDRVRLSIAALMPSDRVGYRISLSGMVNSVIEMKKMSTDAPKTYAELEAEVKRDAVRLFLWCDRLTTHNLEVK